MDVTYSYLTALITSPRDDSAPAWSPNVRAIAFVSNRDFNSEIYVASANGEFQRRLTRDPAPDRAPAWSPDGRRIAFESWRDGKSEVWVVNANGSGLKQLTFGPEE
jgi:TolB protein